MNDSFQVLFYIQGDKAKTFPFLWLHKQWVIAISNTRRYSYTSEKRRGNWEGSAPLPGAVSRVSRERDENTSPRGRNFFLSPSVARSHMACCEHSLITPLTLSRKLVKWSGSTGTIQKSRILFWWILQKYCFVFNIHGRHLELWPGVKLLYCNKPVNLLTE